MDVGFLEEANQKALCNLDICQEELRRHPPDFLRFIGWKGFFERMRFLFYGEEGL